jgi:hypothetical protein
LIASRFSGLVAAIGVIVPFAAQYIASNDMILTTINQTVRRDVLLGWIDDLHSINSTKIA